MEQPGTSSSHASSIAFNLSRAQPCIGFSSLHTASKRQTHALSMKPVVAVRTSGSSPGSTPSRSLRPVAAHRSADRAPEQRQHRPTPLREAAGVSHPPHLPHASLPPLYACAPPPPPVRAHARPERTGHFDAALRTTRAAMGAHLLGRRGVPGRAGDLRLGGLAGLLLAPSLPRSPGVP